MARRLMVNFNKLCVLILGLSVLYNEYLCYYLSYLSWPCLSPSSVPSTNVIFIADPQIQGYRHEPDGIIGAICRWDSDRYLAKIYSWALTYSPTAIVFLGDLMDEGSEADDEEFNNYADRFLRTFPPRSEIKTIYLPGDNDVGGEGVDPVTKEKLERFEAKFGPSSLVNNISPVLDIIPVSRLTESGTYNLTNKIQLISRSKLVVVVSHVPVIPLDGKFAERVVNLISPDIIFSAHDHKGFLYTAERQSLVMRKDIKIFGRKKDESPYTVVTRHQEHEVKSLVEMSETLNEIVVPTTSYRMGVKEMGVGLAQFFEGGEVRYYNLWVPSRFPLLYSYLASLISAVALFLFGKFIELKRSSSPHQKKPSLRKIVA